MGIATYRSTRWNVLFRCSGGFFCLDDLSVQLHVHETRDDHQEDTSGLGRLWHGSVDSNGRNRFSLEANIRECGHSRACARCIVNNLVCRMQLLQLDAG